MTENTFLFTIIILIYLYIIQGNTVIKYDHFVNNNLN